MCVCVDVCVYIYICACVLYAFTKIKNMRCANLKIGFNVFFDLKPGFTHLNMGFLIKTSVALHGLTH